MGKKIQNLTASLRTSRKPFSILLTAVLSLSGIVATAAPANAVTWGSWTRFGNWSQGQLVLDQYRFDPADVTNPVAFDWGFKPDPMLTSVDYSKGIDIENEYYYSTFGSGVVSGACTDNSGVFDCGGGVTVTTTQPSGNPYTVSVSIIPQTYDDLATGQKATPYTYPSWLHNTDLFATTVKISWRSATKTSFNDTLSEVHIPAGKLNFPSLADRAKLKANLNVIASGFNILWNDNSKRYQITPGNTMVTSQQFNTLQTLTWDPVKTFPAGPQTDLTPTAPVASGGTPIRYVKTGGTSDCTVGSATGAITYTSATGTCTVVAITDGDATYSSAQQEITFEINSTPGVTFTAGAGSGTAPTVPAGDVASMPDGTGMTPPAGSGAFAGWSCNDGTDTFAKAAASSLTVLAATTCAAQWTPFDITFGLNGATGTAHSTMSGVITMPDSSGMTAPAGKFFGGYTCTPPGSIYQANDSFTPTANTNCLPVWTAYAVNFDYGSGGGTAPSSASGVTTLPGQGSMTAPSGNGFAGWNCVPGGTYAPGATLTPTAATQCSAVWELIHTVTFSVGEGSGTAPGNQSSPILSMPGLGSMAAPAGDEFAGWSCNDRTTTSNVAATATYSPTADATCTAQWQSIPLVDLNVVVDDKSMVEGGAVPAFTTNSSAHLTAVLCGAYASTDTGFASKLGSGDLASSRSPYVIHCTYSAAPGYRVASHRDGVLTVTKKPVVAKHKLKATYYFDGDSPKLRAATIAGLKALAKKVTSKRGVLVKVVGFVKRTPDTSYDYRLSLQRAKNIAAYLKKLGVKASYSVDSRGIAKENTPTARRAEVSISW